MSLRSSNNQKLLKVGWVKDAHSLKGEVYVQLHARTADWLDSTNELHLQLNEGDAIQAYVIERAKPFKEGLIVKFEGVTDRTAAEGLRKAKVFVDEELLVAAPGDAVYLNQLLDFSVDDKGHAVGQIVGFMSNGPQDLLRIARPGASEALVPLVDAYILSIDFDKKQISMDLPPGLLNIDGPEEE